MKCYELGYKSETIVMISQKSIHHTLSLIKRAITNMK